MKDAIFTLLLVFVMAGFGNAVDNNTPPPDYKGQVAERPLLVKGDRWHYNRRDKILSYDLIEEKDGELQRRSFSCRKQNVTSITILSGDNSSQYVIWPE